MASFVQSEKPSIVLSGLSKWEREELTKERRAKLSKHELVRERAADKVKCPVFFCLPVVAVAFILLVLIGIYIVQPYRKGQELRETTCRVNRTEFLGNVTGTCSHRTEKFKPCIRIFVRFNIDVKQEKEGVLMENEQALVHCDKCSFTFGSTSLLGKPRKCVWRAKLDEEMCLITYLQTYGMPFSPPYPCYYDPRNPTDVIRVKHVSRGEAAYLITIPLLLILLWMGALAFLLFDRYKRRILNKQILTKHDHKGKSNAKENGHVPRGKSPGKSSYDKRKRGAIIDVDDLTGYSVESTAVTENSVLETKVASPPTTKRRRKKKLPCCRPHQQFDYHDEGIILEDKPLSFDTFDQRSYSSSFVAIETSPACSCSHAGYTNIGFDTSPSRDGFSTVFRTNGHFFGVRPGQIMRYLPESVV